MPLLFLPHGHVQEVVQEPRLKAASSFILCRGRCGIYVCLHLCVSFRRLCQTLSLLPRPFMATKEEVLNVICKFTRFIRLSRGERFVCDFSQQRLESFHLLWRIRGKKE